MIQLIQETMVNYQDDDTALTCEIKDRINSDLEHCYAGTEVSMLLDKCSFLDPRFKDKYKLTDEPVQVLLQEASMLESESADRVVSNSQTGQNETESSEPLTKKRKGKFSSIFGKTATFTTNSHSLTVSERIQREAEMYLQYPILDVDESPLQWWSLEASRMPLLSSAAHKYLSVCATSVPSERVFSIGGNVVRSKRNSIKPHKVNQLIFLASSLSKHISDT